MIVERLNCNIVTKLKAQKGWIKISAKNINFAVTCVYTLPSWNSSKTHLGAPPEKRGRAPPRRWASSPLQMLDGNDRYEPLCGGSDQVPISPCDAPRTSAPPPRSPDCHSRNSSSCASAWPACLHLGVTVTVRSGQLVCSMEMVKTPFCSARSQCLGCCSALRLDHSGVNFSLIKLTPARD